MKGARAELAVGSFAVVIFIILMFMTFKVGDFAFTQARGYKIYAIFKNTGGLDEKSRIKIAGVDAGTVEKIELQDGHAKVTLMIYPGVKLYSDASAYIRASGLLGDKYLEIRSGSTLPLLNNGDTIADSHEIVDMDELVRNISTVSMNLMDFISTLNQGNLKQNLQDTMENMRYITDDLRTTISTNKGSITSIVARMDHLAATLDAIAVDNRYPLTNTIGNLKEVSSMLRAEAPGLVRELREASASLKNVMQKAEPAVESAAKDLTGFMGSANSIAKKIDSGEGTIGKLVNDPTLYATFTNAVTGVEQTLNRMAKFKTYVRMDGISLTKIKDSQGNFYVTLAPRPDYYYVLGLSSDPLGKVKITDTVTNGYKKHVEKTTTNLEVTAQFAKRYENTALRLGVKESTFGSGADQFFFNDRLKISADAWDFDKNEAKANNPHVRVGADLFVFKNIFISGGYDNLLNSKTGGPYIGAGISFEDEDLKYLMGSVPNISSK